MLAFTAHILETVHQQPIIYASKLNNNSKSCTYDWRYYTLKAVGGLFFKKKGCIEYRIILTFSNEGKSIGVNTNSCIKHGGCRLER